MKEKKQILKNSKAGSALASSVILLAVAGITVGAVLTNSMSYARLAVKNENLDKAMFLADAGVRAALVKLNASNSGSISLAQSRSYFADTTGFDNASWGFETRVRSIGSSNIVESVGYYEGNNQDVEVSVFLGSGSRSIHALYSHAMFAGNNDGDANYTLEVGGSGSEADFVRGDVYSAGKISRSGSAYLRNPEIINEEDFDGIQDPDTETWDNAFAVQVFSNPLTKVAFDSYVGSVSRYADKFYNNGEYDIGEPFVDTIGNGVYDEGEPFDDDNGNGVRDSGDDYIDDDDNGYYEEGVDTIVDNGNGEYDDGEEWTDDSSHKQRKNGRYDPAGGYWKYKKGSWSWKTTYTTGRRWRKKTYSCAGWPPEQFEDAGDDSFDPGEAYIDQNGIFDEGEEYLDDRNGLYDYGTQAYGSISGMPAPGPGQRSATGGDMLISPPNLGNMYYDVSKSSPKPVAALGRWGHDVAVTAADYAGNGTLITDSAKAEHIFVRNVRTSQYNGQYIDTIGGVRVRSRGYSPVYDNAGSRVDDYFLEDPTDPSYTASVSADSIDGTVYTAPSYVDVKAKDNEKVYYVDGNLYLHASPTFALKFKEPGTRITIVAKGNITISDEFYYNADYDADLQRSDVNSTIVKNPTDALCLIALKNDNCADSGNIYIGDPAHGTGGSIHALLYAENNFIDNNLNTSGQPFISIFGNMTAGNQVKLNRSGSNRTRLDVTLDQRIRKGEVSIPGLPHAISGQLSIQGDTEWHMVPGTWKSWSMIQ